MESIVQQFKKQLPEIFTPVLAEESYAAYSVLRHYGIYCTQHFQEENGKKILNTVDQMYQRNDLFNCNAIENEFLHPIADQLGVSNLMKQLENIPENLRNVYLKVLIKNQKNN